MANRKPTRHSTRSRERAPMKLAAQVSGRDNPTLVWTENTMTTEASSCGVGLTLAHPVQPGRLLQLELPLPSTLRAFAYFKPNYQVWGLVRFIRDNPPDETGATRFSLGLAFAGQHPPRSYEQDPTTLYELRPTRDRNGLWVVREKPRYGSRYQRATEERYPVEATVRVELFNERGMVVQQDICQTSNVSSFGSAVQTKLKAPQGRFVRLTELASGTSLLTLTRACRSLGDGLHSLHLEFMNGAWPETSLPFLHSAPALTRAEFSYF